MLIIKDSVRKSIKNGAAVGIIISVCFAVLPWLRIPLSMFNLVCSAKASHDFFNIFWNSLNEGQKKELLSSSKQAGISLRNLINNLRVEKNYI